MNILFFAKFPPVEGGVACESYWAAHELAETFGHRVFVVTHGAAIERGYCEKLDADDRQRLERRYPGGGEVRVYPLDELQAMDLVIPRSDLVDARLLGMGVRVHEEHRCDVALGYYYQPFGLLAATAGALLGIPSILCHSGSDIGRLANHPALAAAYGAALRSAFRILCSPRPRVAEILIGLGAPPERIHRFRGGALAPWFRDGHARDQPLKLPPAELADWFAGWLGDDSARPYVERGFDRAIKPRFRVGYYGKVHETKGTYDLIAALGSLARDGLELDFTIVAAGSLPRYRELVARLGDEPALARNTTLLPLIAPWKIPAFIASCDVVAMLERDFAIGFHTPRVPREIARCGTALLASGQMVDRMPYANVLADRRNVVRVDPHDRGALADAIRWCATHPEHVEAIAENGKALEVELEGRLPAHSFLARAVQDCLPT